jgi:SulP family sulfate permease
MKNIKTEILSGSTIAIALVPEAISFALLVGAAPQLGLWAAFFMAMSTSLFGGRPGLISGATGATAVIMAGLVKSNGLEYLPLAVVVAGLIQGIVWLTGAWRVFRFIPSHVISGFLIALAVLILLSQFNYLEVGSPDMLKKCLTLIVVGASAIAMWVSSKRLKFPPALSAIAIGTILGIPLGLATVGDLAKVSSGFPSLTSLRIDLSSILIVLPYSLGMAIAGLTESLLTVESVSHTIGEKGSKKKETLAQSIGNIVSGMFGTIGGCVLVGQTNLNIGAGARTRISSFTAAVLLATIILFFGEWIELIPLAGLIGVMLIVVIETGDWKKLRTRSAKVRTVLAITILSAILTHNLAVGVVLGTIAYYLIKRKRQKKSITAL